MPSHYAEEEKKIWEEQEKHRKKIMKNSKKMDVEIDLPERDILKLALLAHEKDVTLNTICIDILKQGIENGEYRFEHDKRPQLLNETE